MTNSGPINTRLAYRRTAAVWLYVPGMSNSSSLKVFPHDAQFKRSRNLPCIRQDHRSCQELSQKNNLRTITRVGFDNSTAWLVAPAFLELDLQSPKGRFHESTHPLGA